MNFSKVSPPFWTARLCLADFFVEKEKRKKAFKRMPFKGLDISSVGGPCLGLL